MRTSKLLLLNLTLLLSSFTPALSGCETVTIKNRTPCAVNGQISLGGTCAGTITSQSFQITIDQVLDMIEARPERPDPANPGKTLPAHPPGIIQSVDDYGEETTELQVSCRILGPDCSYELQKEIENRNKLLEKVRAMQ